VSFEAVSFPVRLLPNRNVSAVFRSHASARVRGPNIGVNIPVTGTLGERDWMLRHLTEPEPDQHEAEENSIPTDGNGFAGCHHGARRTHHGYH
jgi:hypothetical protein